MTECLSFGISSFHFLPQDQSRTDQNYYNDYINSLYNFLGNFSCIENLDITNGKNRYGQPIPIMSFCQDTVDNRDSSLYPFFRFLCIEFEVETTLGVGGDIPTFPIREKTNEKFKVIIRYFHGMPIAFISTTNPKISPSNAAFIVTNFLYKRINEFNKEFKLVIFNPSYLNLNLYLNPSNSTMVEDYTYEYEEDKKSIYFSYNNQTLRFDQAVDILLWDIGKETELIYSLERIRNIMNKKWEDINNQVVEIKNIQEQCFIQRILKNISFIPNRLNILFLSLIEFQNEEMTLRKYIDDKYEKSFIKINPLKNNIENLYAKFNPTPYPKKEISEFISFYEQRSSNTKSAFIAIFGIALGAILAKIFGL